MFSFSGVVTIKASAVTVTATNSELVDTAKSTNIASKPHEDHSTPSRFYSYNVLREAEVPEFSYSRFTEAFPLDSTNALHFVLLSDRKESETPLRAFVNSLLTYSSMPIGLHIVTRHSIEWLDEMDSPVFQVHFYNYERLGYLGNAIRLQRIFGFKSKHTSMPYPLTKPFYSNLPFPRPRAEGEDSVDRVLIIDDDILFWSDPAALFNLLDPAKLALSCPVDPKRVNTYYTETDMASNGHLTRYCNAGMVHMPILPRRPHEDFGSTNDILDMYLNATAAMTKEYPKYRYQCSDQQIYNRLFADQEDRMDNIPCDWNSCKAGVKDKSGSCFNCPSIAVAEKQCKTFHFVNSAFEGANYQVDLKNAPDGSHEYSYFFALQPLRVLHDEFLPRVAGSITEG
jgi:hypothetical protein